ncbi:MAG: per os infectivity factor p74 [Cotesia congregata filamentous virus 2]
MAHDLSYIVTFTRKDLELAEHFTFHREQLLVYNKFIAENPHLDDISIKIWPNFLIMKNNGKINNFAIYVELKIGKKFCEKVHCRSHYPRGKKCTNKDDLQIFNSSDSILTACETGCFNNFNSIEPIDLNTMWSDRLNSCLLTDDLAELAAFDDYNRSDVHPTYNVDTIGTGHLRESTPYIDENGDETWHYTLSKYYCQAYNRTLRDDYVTGKECDVNATQQLTGLVVGDYALALAEYEASKLTSKTINGIIIHEPDVKKPTAKEIKEYRKKNDNYYKPSNDIISPNFINPFITLSDLGFTYENLHILYYTTEDGFPGTLKEPLLIYKSVPERNNIPYMFLEHKDGRRLDHPYDIVHNDIKRRNAVDNYNEYVNLSKDAYITTIQRELDYKVKSILKIIGDVTNSIALGILVDKIKRKILEIGWKISKKVILKSTTSIVYFVCKNFISRTVTKLVARAMAKIFLRLANPLSWSPIGIAIFLATLTFEITMTILDPLGLMSMITQEAVDYHSAYAIAMNKQKYGYGTVELSLPRYLQLKEVYQHFDSMKDAVDHQHNIETWIVDELQDSSFHYENINNTCDIAENVIFKTVTAPDRWTLKKGHFTGTESYIKIEDPDLYCKLNDANILAIKSFYFNLFIETLEVNSLGQVITQDSEEFILNNNNTNSCVYNNQDICSEKKITRDDIFLKNEKKSKYDKKIIIDMTWFILIICSIYFYKVGSIGSISFGNNIPKVTILIVLLILFFNSLVAITFFKNA